MHVPYPQQLKEIRLRALVTEEGRTVVAAAAELGMMTQTATQLLAACASASSFDQPIDSGDAGSRTLADVVPGADPVNVGTVDDRLLSDTFDHALVELDRFLDEREQAVMRCFYTAGPSQPTLEEIADQTGMPATLVRSKRLSARSKLGHPAANLRQQLGR